MTRARIPAREPAAIWRMQPDSPLTITSRGVEDLAHLVLL